MTYKSIIIVRNFQIILCNCKAIIIAKGLYGHDFQLICTTSHPFARRYPHDLSVLILDLHFYVLNFRSLFLITWYTCNGGTKLFYIHVHVCTMNLCLNLTLCRILSETWKMKKDLICFKTQYPRCSFHVWKSTVKDGVMKTLQKNGYCKLR